MTQRTRREMRKEEPIVIGQGEISGIYIAVYGG